MLSLIACENSSENVQDDYETPITDDNHIAEENSSSNADVTLPEDQRKKITEWEENAMTTNPMMAGARAIGAQADAMRIAAANESGAMNGFMGMGMAMNASGVNHINLGKCKKCSQ